VFEDLQSSTDLSVLRFGGTSSASITVVVALSVLSFLSSFWWLFLLLPPLRGVSPLFWWLRFDGGDESGLWSGHVYAVFLGDVEVMLGFGFGCFMWWSR
jgi:hypothetical protein